MWSFVLHSEVRNVGIKNSQKLKGSQVVNIPQQTSWSYTLLDRFSGGVRYAPSYELRVSAIALDTRL